MNNEKGYVAISTLLLILLVSLMMFGLFYGKIMSTNKDVADSSLLSGEIVEDKNGVERLHNLLSNNNSFEGNITYEDLNRDYKIQTISEDFSTVNLRLDSGYYKEFNIKNRTPISINTNISRDSILKGYSYDAKLMLNGEDLLEGSGIGLKSNYTHTVKAGKLYNLETNEYNLGDVKLEITNVVNGTVTASISYRNLDERELLLKGSGLNRKVLINNTSESTEVVFKEGGV